MKNKEFKILDFINFGNYPGYCMVSFGFNYEEICRILKRKKADGWLRGIADEKDLFESTSYLACHREMCNPATKEKANFYYIFFKECFTPTPDNIIYLAHECLHITQYYLPRVLDRNKEHEAEAYFHTHLMRQCLKLTNKK